MMVVVMRVRDSWLVINLNRRRLRWRIVEMSMHRCRLMELVKVPGRLLLSDQGVGDRCTTLADTAQQWYGIPHQYGPDYVLLKGLQVLPFDLVIEGVIDSLNSMELLIFICLVILSAYVLIVGLARPVLLLASVHIELRHMQSTYLSVAVVVITVLVRAEEKLDFVIEAVAEVRVLVPSSFLFGEV